MKYVLLVTLFFLVACSTRLMLVIESEDATRGKVEMSKEQLDEQVISVKPTLPTP